MGIFRWHVTDWRRQKWPEMKETHPISYLLMFISFWCGFPVDSDNETTRHSLTADCVMFNLNRSEFTRLLFIWSISESDLQAHFRWCITYTHCPRLRQSSPPPKKSLKQHFVITERKGRQTLCVKSRNICVSSKRLRDVIISFESKNICFREHTFVISFTFLTFFYVPRGSWKRVTLG